MENGVVGNYDPAGAVGWSRLPETRTRGKNQHPPSTIFRIVTVNLLKVLLMVAAIWGAVQIHYTVRTRAMRALADRWGFRYLGPPPPRWWWPVSHPVVRPPVPSWISHLHLHGSITRIWNVIEGTRDGVTVLIFDGIIGEYRNSHPCTLIACQTEQNPFKKVASVDRVLQAHGWTVLHGVWLLWFSWTMRVRRIDQHISDLRPM
jgi:hypothetical protein